MDELRADFTDNEKHTIINSLKDEYGDQKFSDELVLLECQDLWRKGCHHIDKECSNQCDDCPLCTWEKRNPEYKDDELAKRLKELRAEARGVQKAEIAKRLAEERKKNGIRLMHSFVTNEQVAKAKQVLIDNGIEEDEAETVLQAIGYALLDVELIYPGE